MKGKKVAIVTGASSGIGQAVARQLAHQGYNLILVARRENRLKTLANQLETSYQCDCLVLAGDLKQARFIERVVDQTMTYFGQIDLLFQAAGYGIFKGATNFTYEEIQDMFALNVFAMMYLAQLVALEMVDQGQGQIYLVASSAGKLPTASASIYAASKAAMIAYADALRLELRPLGIPVVTINPGPVATPFFDRDQNSRNYFNIVKDLALDVDNLAERIVRSIESPRKYKREINAPYLLQVAHQISSIFPTISDIFNLRLFNLKEK